MPKRKRQTPDNMPSAVAPVPRSEEGDNLLQPEQKVQIHFFRGGTYDAMDITVHCFWWVALPRNVPGMSTGVVHFGVRTYDVRQKGPNPLELLMSRGWRSLRRDIKPMRTLTPEDGDTLIPPNLELGDEDSSPSRSNVLGVWESIIKSGLLFEVTELTPDDSEIESSIQTQEMEVVNKGMERPEYSDVIEQLQDELHAHEKMVRSKVDNTNQKLTVQSATIALDLSLLHDHRSATVPDASLTSKPQTLDRPSSTDAEQSSPEKKLQLDVGILCSLLRHWTSMASQPIRIRWNVKVSDSSSSLVKGYMPLNLSCLKELSRKYTERRDEATVSNQGDIQDPYDVYPRRLWDLETNRVIPTYFLDCQLQIASSGEVVRTEQTRSPDSIKFPSFVAISHSWRAGHDLESLETPINQCAWPVPIPKGLDLNALRQNLLVKFPQHRYCWLDVLCLRQMETRAKPDDQSAMTHPLVDVLALGRDYSGDLRARELRVDVPTIGNVYNKADHIYRFYNGLGREALTDDWDDSRHWMNRAWCLQECLPDKMVDGLGLSVSDAISKPNFYNIHTIRRGVIKRAREHIEELSTIVKETSVIALASEMGKRHAAHEVDKLAGLSYLIRLPQLPTYSEYAPVAVAWERCVRKMTKKSLEELFWTCPVGGDSQAGATWIPSWPALQSCPATFVPYYTIATSVPDLHAQPRLWRDMGDFRAHVNARQDANLSWRVQAFGIRNIERVAQGDYLIKFYPVSDHDQEHQQDGDNLLWRRFFISHSELDLDISLLDLAAGDQEDGIPLGLQSLEKYDLYRRLPGIKRTCVLVSQFKPKVDRCSVWMLLQRERRAGANPGNWRKIALLRTDELDMTRGSERMAFVKLSLQGDLHQNIVMELEIKDIVNQPVGN